MRELMGGKPKGAIKVKTVSDGRGTIPSFKLTRAQYRPVPTAYR
jgi:hypothetical protein